MRYDLIKSKDIDRFLKDIYDAYLIKDIDKVFCFSRRHVDFLNSEDGKFLRGLFWFYKDNLYNPDVNFLEFFYIIKIRGLEDISNNLEYFVYEVINAGRKHGWSSILGMSGELKFSDFYILIRFLNNFKYPCNPEVLKIMAMLVNCGYYPISNLLINDKLWVLDIIDFFYLDIDYKDKLKIKRLLFYIYKTEKEAFFNLFSSVFRFLMTIIKADKTNDGRILLKKDLSFESICGGVFLEKVCEEFSNIVGLLV